MTQQQPEPTQVDPQAVVNDLAQQIAQQSVTLAMVRAQLAQVLAERETLIAAQEANQGAAREG